MRIFDGRDDLGGAVGEHLGWSDWLHVDQQQIDGFAELTGDRQWIHVDRERAETGPFGTTVAHGYLTVALLPQFRQQIFEIRGARMALNYGLNKVRFPAPLPSDSNVRASAELTEIVDHGDDSDLIVRYVVECDRATKPVCVADSVVRVYF